MVVQFKNNTETFDCSPPVEQKLFKNGTPSGWRIIFSVYGSISSSDVDKLINKESIQELIFEAPNGVTLPITGYDNIVACTIRHEEQMTTTEIQLSKTYEEGDVSNA